MQDLWLLSTDFVQGIGVDTHIPYTDGAYANVSAVIGDLKYLGFDQVRDGLSTGLNGSAPFSTYVQLARAGIKFTLIADGATDADLRAELKLLEQLQTTVPGSVVAVEGPNEINNFSFTFDGVSGLSGAIAEQQGIYKAVHSDPILTGVAIDYFTGYGAGGIGVGPDPSVTPGLADFDNQHPYPAGNQAPSSFISRSAALGNEQSASGPAVYTETGYSSIYSGADIQAKYELDLLMDAASQNISKTFLYELLDAYAPGSQQGDSGRGLFDYTGAPKPVATSIHNLTTVLQSVVTSSQIGPIGYTVGNLPATGKSLGLIKPDGSDVIVVWNEPSIGKGATLTAPPVAVTVDLKQSYGLIQVFDPLSGTTPVATYKDAEFVTLGLTDHPLLIEVSNTSPPFAAASLSSSLPPSSGSSSLPSVGSGPDTLVLYLAETAVGGINSQFTVSVDGAQIGGVQTVTAAQAQAQQQTLSLSGTFGAGPHAVAINVRNGFTGAAADAGRVLYVNAAALDGKATFLNAVQRFNGAVNYTIQAPQTPVVSNAGTNDTLVLTLAETPASGQDARFLVSVDGQLVGGVQTASALYAQNRTQDIALTGNFGAGPHTVAVDLLNGFTGDQADVGRTLYLDAITLDGQTTFTNGIQQFSGSTAYAAKAPSAPLPSNAGTQDTLVLNVSETAASGQDARFLVSVDGQLIGGSTIVTASYAAGASQAVTVTGNFGAGPHTVTVDMLNGFTGQAADAGRTLYINSITLDGTNTLEKASLNYDGSASYVVSGANSSSSTMTPTNTPSPSTGTGPTNSTGPTGTGPATGSGPTITNPSPSSGSSSLPSVGSGPDTLVLYLAETAVGGINSQFTVSVDGAQIGGVQTVTAAQAQAQQQTLSLSGTFGAGPHAVAINVRNGFTGAAADAGRVLYVNAAALDGKATFLNAVQRFNGAVNYTIQAPQTPVVSNAGTNDTLVLTLAETPASGQDARFLVSVDGQLVGGVQTASALYAQNRTQDIALTGNFGAGPHTVAVDLLNGFTGDQADVGRTLYLDAITLDGQTTFTNGIQQFSGSTAYAAKAPSAPLPSNAGTQDTLVLNVSETAASGQDARFLVSVDGQLIGGSTIVTASYAAGASQAVTVTGNFGAGPHTVTVDMLNGFTGQAADAGRTLYINSITLDGTNTLEKASLNYDGSASYVVSGANSSSSTMTPTNTPSPSTGTGPTNSTGPTGTGPATGSGPTITNPSPPTPVTSTGAKPAAVADHGNVPVTYNWYPTTQLAHFLAAEASVQAGVANARAKIIAIGDSTTVGVVGTPGGRGTVSYPAQLAAALTTDGLSANSNDFLGGGLSVDSRITLLGGAVWSGAQAAGGQLIQTSAAGQGANFQPITAVQANRIEVDIFDTSNSAFSVSINGGPMLKSVQTTGSNTMKAFDLDIPSSLINSVTIQSTTSNAVFLEGVSLLNSTTPSIEVYNAGVGGADSGLISSTSLAGYGEIPGVAGIAPNLALINFGINDIKNSTETTSQTVSNIQAAITTLRSINADPIVLIPTPLDGYASQYNALRAALQTVSTMMNVPLIDLSATYGNNEPALAAAGLMVDSVHPAPALYADIGARIANLLTDAATGTVLPAAKIGY